ncbi:nucleophosmin 1b isoform X2 [Oryzias melastigma]|uniref:nucleophosmin 1b isoform X2 n=1 Tax=Oryzias melastigma TaxID=30732 RepID=UPI00168D64EB|nr:nucleophosmin 1b isoform X2 [Oryzias melastigma]
MEDDASGCGGAQMFLFGCTLTSCKQEFKVEVDNEDAEQQLSLKVVCLGAEAEDEFHMVEVEGLTYDAKITKVPLVVLKPSVMPSMNLGGFEITPPVTFRLRLGTGPVHISGQHFVSEKDSEEEEEHNTSPVKQPANMSSRNKPALKKLKMDSDEDEEDDEDNEEDDDIQYGDGGDFTSRKNMGKVFEKLHTPGKDKPQAGPSNSLSLTEIKSKLSTAAKEGKPLPKTEQKFENFLKSSFKITDKQVVKDLWNFLKMQKVQMK